MQPLRVIDSHLHEPSIWLDWSEIDDVTRRKLMTELTLGAMDNVGVDAAVLYPVQDTIWAQEMCRQFPGRFGWVENARELVAEPDIEDRLVDAMRDPSLRAWRINLVVPPTEAERYQAGAYDQALVACERHGMPVFIHSAGRLEIVEEVASRHPELTLIVDHFGLPQHPRDDPPFARLPQVAALARHANVAVKFGAAILYSDERFPHRDLWPHLRTLIDAFGIERMMWASDITRVRGRMGTIAVPGFDQYHGRHTYAEALHFVRDTDALSDEEKRLLLGASAERILRFAR